jgi:hypothetical protein
LKKTVVIHQPDFLPYLGFFHRLLFCDLYVIFDNVQFLGGSRSWHRRDKIKTPKGETWITVGVKKAPQKTLINEIVLTNETDWRQDNLNLIIENYKRTPYYSEIFPYMKELFSYSSENLLKFNIKSIQILMELFDIKVDMVLASTLNVTGKKNELLVDILNRVVATHYLSGIGAKDYYDPEPFAEAGIEVVWQEFSHPVYPQIHGEFVPYLSSIDLLFNCGIERSREILRSC